MSDDRKAVAEERIADALTADQSLEPDVVQMESRLLLESIAHALIYVGDQLAAIHKALR